MGKNRLLIKMASVTLVCALALGGCMFMSTCVGSTHIEAKEIFAVLTGQDRTSTAWAIVTEIRIPRTILAALAGAGLSLGGMVFQALLRNPLAEPYILGISGGAATGAVGSVVLGLASFWTMAAGSLAGSLLATLTVLSLAWRNMRCGSGMLLLSGVMVNAFCSAIILFFITMTRLNSLQYVLFWLMGNLSSPPGRDLALFFTILLPCFCVIFLMSQPMNLMLLGEHQARSLGVRVGMISAVLTVTVSVMVAVTVSFCGLLGFVGLVVPHIFRMMFGPDHRILSPACCMGGAAYLVLCDTLARAIPVNGELPTGVITAAIGAPVFIYLLKRKGHGSID